MAIKQLSPEEVRTWSLEQKDRWWLANVFRGDMPQLTIRSAITGVVLGGVLSLTNLYVGIRTGWTLGVGITSVVLAFIAFKLFKTMRLGSDLTILENNAMQSIATSAGYMTSPLIASLPAYMMVTGRVIPWWQVILWSVCISTMGALFAFPLKKRFVNDEQLPFPEGYAAGVVMDNIHTQSGAVGVFKAKVLIAGGVLSAFIQAVRSEKFMRVIRIPFALPEYWDDLVYKLGASPRLAGIMLRDLNVQVDTSIVMFGTGGLMGVKAGSSLLLGALVNYLVIAPILFNQEIIKGAGFGPITRWSLWWGVAMMTTSSLFSFFSKPAVLVSSFRGFFGKAKREDVLGHIELPLKVSAIGIPLLGAVVVAMGHVFFGITWWMGAIAIPLVFFFAIIAVNSTGLTSITPIGAMGKLTQLTFGAIAPGNMTTNLMTAGITGETVSSASNLLMDIKPGYMLGAKPRQQAIGHVIGIVAGSLAAVPAFYSMFGGDLSQFGSDRFPLPSAQVWKAVAELLAKGFGSIHPSARWAMLAGAVLGIVFEWANLKTKGRFPLSAVGLSLASVVPFADCLSMAAGAIFFWFMGWRLKEATSLGHRTFVENRETLCAGIIAGGAIIGVLFIWARLI